MIYCLWKHCLCSLMYLCWMDFWQHCTLMEVFVEHYQRVWQRCLVVAVDIVVVAEVAAAVAVVAADVVVPPFDCHLET